MGMAMLSREPQPGLPVYTTDERRLGTVKAVTTTTLQIGRRFRRDLCIPLRHVALTILGDSNTESRVNLTLSSKQLSAAGSIQTTTLPVTSPLADFPQPQ